MVTRRTLTDRQKNLLRCIVKYQKAHGFSPSVRDLCEMTGVRSTSTVRDLCEMTGVRSTSTVHAQLKALEENGYIERMRECPRTLCVKAKV